MLRKKSNFKITNSIVAVIALFALITTTIVSCDEAPGHNTGTMSVLLHDAPGDYQHLWVEILRVEVNATDNEGSGWQTISEPNQQYDILSLINGAYELLGEAELEAGTYQQIRLILGENNVLVKDGEEYNLKVPSGQQTGIKLNVNATIEPGIEYTLLLDFDADRSVVRQGATNNYLLKPVIKAINQAETGNIAGIVTPVDVNPWIYAIAGSDTVSTTRIEENTGAFKLVGLPEGSFTISFEPLNENYESRTIEEVEVIIGESTDLGTIDFSSEDEENDNDE